MPWAVADDRVITAPGTAPVSFTREVLRSLGIDDDNLAAYLTMHGAEHGQPPAA